MEKSRHFQEFWIRQEEKQYPLRKPEYLQINLALRDKLRFKLTIEQLKIFSKFCFQKALFCIILALYAMPQKR